MEPSTTDPRAERLRRISRIAMPILLVLSCVCLVAALAMQPPHRNPQPVVQEQAAPELADFSFTERNGGIVTKADLRGKVWIGSFVFTHCTGPCPSVSATLARLQSELNLASEPDLRLVTFTLDPDRDTPDQLKKYAEHYHADEKRWLFLTGKESDLMHLSEESFKISAARTKLANPPPGREIDHDTWLVAIDKTGHIRGYFHGWCGQHDQEQKCVQYEESLKQLKETVAALLKE